MSEQVRSECDLILDRVARPFDLAAEFRGLAEAGRGEHCVGQEGDERLLLENGAFKASITQMFFELNRGLGYTQAPRIE